MGTKETVFLCDLCPNEFAGHEAKNHYGHDHEPGGEFKYTAHAIPEDKRGKWIAVESFRLDICPKCRYKIITFLGDMLIMNQPVEDETP